MAGGGIGNLIGSSVEVGPAPESTGPTDEERRLAAIAAGGPSSVGVAPPTVVAAPSAPQPSRGLSGVLPIVVGAPGTGPTPPPSPAMVSMPAPGGNTEPQPAGSVAVPSIQYTPGSPGRLIPEHEARRGRTVQAEKGIPIPEEALAEYDAANVDRSAAVQMGVENEQEAARAERQKIAAQQELMRQSTERQKRSGEERERTLGLLQQQSEELAPDVKRTWANMNDFTRVRFAIGAFLGDIAEARTGKNRAREQISEYVANDMAAQQNAYDANAKRMAWAREQFADRDAAMAAVEAAKLKSIELETQRQLAGVKDKAAQQRGLELIAGLREQRAQLLDTAAQRAADKVTESTSYAQVAAQVVGGSGPRAVPSTVRRAAEGYLANGGDPNKLPEFLKMQGVDRATIGSTMMGLSTPTGAYEQRAKASEREAEAAVKSAPSAATYVPEAGGFATNIEDAKAIKDIATARREMNAILDETQRLHEQAGVLSALPGADGSLKARAAVLRARTIGIARKYYGTGAAMSVQEMVDQVEPMVADPVSFSAQIRSGRFNEQIAATRATLDGAFESAVGSRGIAPGRLERRGNRMVPVLEGEVPAGGDSAAAAADFAPAGK